MKKYLEGVYHTVTLVYYLYVMKYTSELEFKKSNDQRVIEMEEFASRYFTSWNMVIQILYLSLAVAADMLHLFPESFRKFEQKLLTIKGYIFTSLMFPCTVFVCAMFWSVYTINREWVLPATADAIVPAWINHSMHTFILFPIFMEILITNHLLPNSKLALTGVSVLLLIYNVIFFLTYYQCGRWLYGLFYILDWQQRYFFMFLNYVMIVLFMKIGITLQNFRAKYKETISKYIKAEKIF